MVKIAAGIILYNPELGLLKKNVEAIISQVEFVILIDNNSQNIFEIEKEYENEMKIIIVKNKKNLGIAKALNQVIEYCIENHYEWVLTLDQDSVSPPNLISEYKKYILCKDIGIICSNIIDRNELEEKISLSSEGSYTFINECITSGSLINVKLCKRIDLFDEKMFIDMVDFEYCYRLVNNGYKILRINHLFLLHQLGDLKVFNFIHRKVKVGNHSPLRKYYYFRNSVYFIKKHKKVKVFIKITKKMISKFLQTVMYEDEKINKLKSINKGIYDGIFM